MVFERVLCIPFSPDGFEIEKESEGDDASMINTVNDNMRTAEKIVGIGPETSQGVELVSYRASVILEEEGAQDEL